MKKYYAPDEAIVVDQRDLQNVVTSEIREVYFASDVDARIAELEDALREIAGYPQPDEDLDSVAQDMRRCARGVLRPSS